MMAEAIPGHRRPASGPRMHVHNYGETNKVAEKEFSVDVETCLSTQSQIVMAQKKLSM